MKRLLSTNVSRLASLLIALLLGVVVVAITEIIFRQIDLFAPPAFSKKIAVSDIITLKTINPEYARRFFTEVNVAGMRMAPHPFLEPSTSKNSKKLRIVVAGGSSVQGYPHPRRLTAAAYARSMLSDIYPEYSVEVFNVGITAISSFAVNKVVEDALSLNPQIVVVYAGHNEIYGVYGSASLSSGGNSQLIKSIHYELMQLGLTGFLRFVIGELRGPPSLDSRALVNVMSDAGLVSPGDIRRKEALENLRENMFELATKCKQKGIVLIVCTVASNERGFAPAFEEPEITGDRLSSWRNNIDLGIKALYDSPETSKSHFASAIDLAGEHAWSLFHYGRALEALGDADSAHLYYLRARDADPYPWRASSEVNKTLKEVSTELELTLVDVEKIFREKSPSSGIGWELMDDHLHPSNLGQLLLARSWSKAVKSDLLSLNSYGKIRLDEEYQRRHGYLALERMAVYTEMHSLLSEPPMDRGNEEHVRILQQKADSLWVRLTKGERKGFHFWKSGSSGRSLALSSADQLFANQEWELASRYYMASQLEEPYTPWGDIWANLRAARCILLDGRRNLNSFERGQLELIPSRINLIAQTDSFSPSIKMFFLGYCKYLLGKSGIKEIEFAAQSDDVRRLFFYDVLSILCEELPRIGRTLDAERYVREITTFVDQISYGDHLLEILAEKK